MRLPSRPSPWRGTDAAAQVLARLTEQLIVLRRQRDEIAEHASGWSRCTLFRRS